MADKFVPVSAQYDTDTLDPTSKREWTVWIDTDDDQALDDVTAQVFNNEIKGGGSSKKAKQFTVRLRNAAGSIPVGAYANAICQLDVEIGDEGAATIFAGFVSDKGAQRDKRSGRDDTVLVTMFDQRVRNSKHRLDPAIFINFDIVDTASPSTSLLHQLAAAMGIASGDVQAVSVAETKDYLPLHNNTRPWDELKKLAECYKGDLTIRYDGDLLFESRHETGWTEPTSEFTLDGDFVHRYRGRSLGISANRVSSNWQDWEGLDAGSTLYRNTENWDQDTNKCSIVLGASAYWPGPGALDRARLTYKNPDSGERYRLAHTIIMPTIGAEDSGCDIEYSDNAPTIVSFNGSTSATVANPDKAEIILQAHASGTTITKFEVRGTPIRLEGDRFVQRKDSGITDEEDYVDKEIDGKYATSDDQLSETLGWWVDWGSVDRDMYDIRCHFLPQVQENAVVLFNPHSGLSQNCFVEAYQHVCRGAPATWSTQLTLREKDTIVVSGSPEITEENEENGSESEASASYLTQTQHQQGYTHTGSGGTQTPTVPTIDTTKSFGVKGAIVVEWDRQLNLTNFDRYEVQVSEDDSTWYDLEFDLTDWKGTASLDTDWAGEFIVHTVPFDMDANLEPIGRALYYRVRRVTKAPVASSWSTSVQVTSSVIDTGDIAANAITANKLAVQVLNAMIAEITNSIKILGTTGYSGFTGLAHEETFTVTETGSNLDGEYFLISSPADDYYVWYDVDSGSTDPAVTDRLAIEVDVGAADSAITVADKTATAVAAIAAFSATTDSSDEVNVVSSDIGVTKTAWTIGDTAHTKVVDVTGSDPTAPSGGDHMIYLDGDEVVLQEYDGVNTAYRDMLRVGGQDGSGVLKEWFQGRGLRNLDRTTQHQKWPTSTAWLYDFSYATAPAIASKRNWDDDSSYRGGGGSTVSTPVKFGSFAFQVDTASDSTWTTGQTGMEDCYLGCWVRFPTTAPTSIGTLLMFRMSSNDYVRIGVDANGDFVLTVKKNASAQSVTITDLGGGALAADTWYFIGLMWDEANGTAYLVANDQVGSVVNASPWGTAAAVTMRFNGLSSPQPVFDDVIFDIVGGADINPWLLVQHYSSDLPWAPYQSGPNDVELDADANVVAHAPMLALGGYREHVEVVERAFTFTDRGPSHIVVGGARTITLPDAESNRGRWIRIWNDDNDTVTINCAGSDQISTPAGHADITTAELWHDGEIFQAISMLDESNVYHWFSIPQRVMIPENLRATTSIVASGSSTTSAVVNFSPYLPPGAYHAWAPTLMRINNNTALQSLYNTVGGVSGGFNNRIMALRNTDPPAAQDYMYVAPYELEDDRDASYAVSWSGVDVWIYEPWEYMRA